MTTGYTLMTQAYRKAIGKKYSIMAHIEFKNFDADFKVLEKQLLLIKKDSFANNERIIIEHQDTDFYLPEFSYGLGLYNVFTAFKKIDIPLFTMLLFTNHFGIAQEVNRLAPDPNDRPTVIESFITFKHYSNNYQPIDLDVDQINMPGLCMLGASRVHRHAMYNFLRDENLLPVVATSINGLQ